MSSSSPALEACLQELIDKAWSARAKELRQCSHCGVSESFSKMPFSRCGACRGSTYCSQNCQRLAWKNHKPECQERVRVIQNAKIEPTGGLPFSNVPSSMSTDRVSAIIMDWIDSMRVPLTTFAFFSSGLIPLKATGYNRPPIIPHIILSINDAGKAFPDIVYLQPAAEALMQEALAKMHDRCAQMPGIAGTAIIRTCCGPFSYDVPIRATESERSSEVPPTLLNMGDWDWLEFLRKARKA